MPSTATGLYFDATDLRAPWQPPRLPIAMYHGIGTTSDIWNGWLPVLAHQYRVLRFDTRGFGRSRAAWRASPTMDVLIEDLFAVADAASERRLHLIGESLGGTVAMAAALARPERVASVTISNATHRGTGIARVRGWRKEVERDGMAGWAERMMDARFTPDAPISAEQRAWFDQTQAGSDAEPILELGEMLAGLDISDAVRAFPVPLLILSPDASPFTTTAMAAELKDLVPDAELQVFAHTRHGLPFSHARACAETVERFLATRFP
jgi:pimeloyl-ACP methyl ester carboxylesterase